MSLQFLTVALLCVLSTTHGFQQRSSILPNGHFCEGKSDGNHADPDNCSHFFQCRGGATFVEQCPMGTLFNPEDGNCDWAQKVDCHATPGPATEAPKPSTDKVVTHKPKTSAPETVAPENTTPGGTPKPRTTRNPIGPSGKAICKRVVCYFTNWAQYRQGAAKQFPTDVDGSLCTHLVFAFAKLNGNHLHAFEWNDESTDWSTGNYEKVMKLKEKNPDLKIILAVGGWNMASAPFTAMVKTQTSRADFVKSTIKFLRKRGFDGIDMDWEYPANRGSPPEDKGRFSSLLRELRAAFTEEASKTNKESLMITAAVSAGKKTIDPAYDIPVMNQELDFINLMSYDLHGSWEDHTGHNSPLYKGSWETGDDALLNVDWAAKYWVQKGASKDKLVIGVPLYGRTFQLKSASETGVGAHARGAGAAGRHTREKGFVAYYEICEMLKAGAKSHFIEEQRVPYLVKGDQWIGYDDASSLKEKVNYIRDNEYGGVMMWDVSLDDIRGSYCGQGPYPLMHAILNQCNA